MHGLGELLVVWKISGKYFSLKTQSTHSVEILLEGELSFSQSIPKVLRADHACVHIDGAGLLPPLPPGLHSRGQEPEFK